MTQEPRAVHLDTASVWRVSSSCLEVPSKELKKLGDYKSFDTILPTKWSFVPLVLTVGWA